MNEIRFLNTTHFSRDNNCYLIRNKKKKKLQSVHTKYNYGLWPVRMHNSRYYVRLCKHDDNNLIIFLCYFNKTRLNQTDNVLWFIFNDISFLVDKKNEINEQQP